MAPLTLHSSHQLTHVSCKTILGGRTRQTHSSEKVFNQFVNDHLSDNLTRSDPWDFSQSQWVCECWEECGVDISAWEDSDWWWWSGLASYHPQLHQNLLQTDQHHQCHQQQLLVEEICPSQSENWNIHKIILILSKYFITHQNSWTPVSDIRIINRIRATTRPPSMTELLNQSLFC